MKKLIIGIVSLILMSCNNQSKEGTSLKLEKQKILINKLNETIDSLKQECVYSEILKLNFKPSETKLIYGEENSSNAIYEYLQSYGMGYEDYIFYTRTTTHEASPIFLSSVSFSNSDFGYWIKDDKENVIEEYKMQENLVSNLAKNNPDKLEILTQSNLIEGRKKALELAIKTLKKQ